MRIDERDIMFSRMTRKKNTAEYEDYYKNNPNLKDIDDEIRALPELDSDETAFYSPINTPIVSATFNFLSDIKNLVNGPEISEKRLEDTPENFTAKIKGLAKYYGADLCNIAICDESYYYSHRGREDDIYGDKVDNLYKNTIVFAVEMDKSYIDTAPKLPESI